MALVLFFVYYNPEIENYPGKSFLNSIGFLEGKYADFSEGWYEEVG
jgi:hypothetical protein